MLDRRIVVLLLVPSILFLLVFFYLPFVILMYYSVSDANGGITLENYVDIFTSRFYLSIMGYSGIIATLTTLITLAMAYPVAYYVVFKADPRLKPVLITLLIAPFWIDFLLRAYSIKVLIDPLGLREGFATLLYGMVYEFFPFMLLPLYAGMSAVPQNVIMSARVHGAGGLALFTRVLLPLTLSSILAGGVLVFLMSFTEFVIPALLGGVKGYTIGYAVYDLFFKYRDVYRGSALSIVLSLSALVVTIIIARRVGVVQRILSQ